MGDNRKDFGTAGGQESRTAESWLGRHGPWVLLLVYLHYCIQVAMELLGGRVDLLGMLPPMAFSVLVLMVASFVGVVARAVAQIVQRASWTTILRDILGEPSWWRSWYPRTLRNPASVWDRLPPQLRVMRTVIWLELLLLPAGFLMVLFVLPTFQAAYESVGLEFPLMMSMYSLAVVAGGYLLPLILLAALVQGGRWRIRHGLTPMVALKVWVSVRPEFWRDTEARELLRN